MSIEAPQPTTSGEHWKDGGTGVTNFDASERALFEAAVKAFGDADLVIRDKPFGRGLPEWMSLHDLRAPRELGGFWKIFRELKAQDASARELVGVLK